MTSYLHFLSRNKLYTSIALSLMAVAIVALAVLGQTLRIATRNPIEGIKTE